MIIVPKLGERNISLTKDVLAVINGKVEIQMNTRDLPISFAACSLVINNILKSRHLDEVVLHMPFTLHTFEVFVASARHRKSLIGFIRMVEALSYKHGIKIGILFHQEGSTELLETIDPEFKVINDILDSIQNDNVYLLVENCLPCLNDYDVKRIPSFRLMELIQHPKLFKCIDVCHLRSYENIFRTTVSIPEHIYKRVRWVHFSYTDNHDGYCDKTTHGIKHPNLQSLWIDLDYLIWNGIDISTTPIVAEITELDYNLYPQMIEEIKLLNIFNNQEIVHERLKLPLRIVI